MRAEGGDLLKLIMVAGDMDLTDFMKGGKME
jgi:hypothetical protein